MRVVAKKYNCILKNKLRKVEKCFLFFKLLGFDLCGFKCFDHGRHQCLKGNQFPSRLRNITSILSSSFVGSKGVSPLASSASN